MPTNTSGGTTTSLDNAPQAKDDLFAALEDEILYFDVMANDLGGNAKTLWSIDETSDDGSGDLVAKDVADVVEYSELGAKISLTPDGKIKYDTTGLDALAAGETVTDQFTYAIRLSNGTLSWATVTVTLTGTNDAPVAVDDTASVDEDASTSGSVATNDSDVDNGAVLSYALVDPAPTGLTFNPDGSWTFDAASYDSLAEGEQLVLTIPYTVTDEHGASDTGELTITVTGINDGPIANADADTTSENAVLTVDVLANDTDADQGAVLTVVSASAPAGEGTASVVGNQVQFDPGTDFDYLNVGDSVVVTVSYTIEDEHGASSSSTLDITVTGTNDAAAIGGVTSGEITEDAAPNTVSGTATAADVDNTPNTFQANAGNTAYGSFTIAANGEWVYTLDNSNAAVQALGAGVMLMDSFTIYSEDGTAQVVSVTIHGADEVIVVTPPPTFNGADPNDFDNLTGGPSNNSLIINGDNGDNTITGGAANQTINGDNGNDTIYGGGGDDIINGNNHDDDLYGQAGSDTVNGNNQDDNLYGGSGDDILNGGNQSDTIYGGSGNDTISGSAGNDLIIGGYGADLLTGGADDDIFRYLSKLDTNDTITDFAAGDQLDLSQIDANDMLGGDQDFFWGGDDGPIANGLWFTYDSGTNTTTLYGDTDGNLATAEFMLTLQNFSGFAPYENPASPPPATLLDG